jgi:hypothetical protein
MGEFPEGHNPFGIGGLWLCNKVRCVAQRTKVRTQDCL